MNTNPHRNTWQDTFLQLLHPWFANVSKVMVPSFRPFRPFRPSPWRIGELPAKWSWVYVRMSCWEMFGCHDVSYWKDKHVCHFWCLLWRKKTCSCSSMKVDGKAGSLSSSISRTHKLGNIDLQDHFQVAKLPFSLHTQTSNVSFEMIQWSNKKAVAILEETPSALGLLGPHNKMGAPRSDVFFCRSLWIPAAFHAHPWMTLKLRPKQRTIWSRWFGEEQVVALIFLSPRFFRSSIYMASILNFPITCINGSLL